MSESSLSTNRSHEIPEQKEHGEVAEAELVELLAEWNIPIEEWNTGEAKSLQHLLKELQEGESTLTPVEDGRGTNVLMRRTRVAAIDVSYTDPTSGDQFHLVEEKQVFKDGRTKTRPHVTTSIGEKLKASEDGDEAAVRAVEEELGFTPQSVEFTGTESISKVSNSYPGLATELSLDYYRCEASPETYKPEGYVERQTDKDIYFVWEKQDKS